MTKMEQLEAKQAKLKEEMQENAKLLKQMRRAERAEAERKAREEEIEKALELYRYCMSTDRVFSDGKRALLYDYVRGLKPEVLAPHAG